MTDDFTWHENALKGIRGPIHDGEPQSGFYRQRRQDKTYEPVAYWKDTATGEQRCHINGKSVDIDRMMHVWPFASANPISAEAYWHRIDTGQWLDNDASAAESAKGPEIDPATDPVGSMRAEIEKARTGLPAYKAIDSDEQAAKAQTLRSALTALSGKAEKARKAEKEPHLEASRRVDAKWQPLVKIAQEGADDIRGELGKWEDIKRENARRAAEDTRKLEEQAARDAQFENAKPGLIHKEPPAPVTPIVPNTPPPSTRIKGASGRAASVTIKRIVTAIDLDAAWKQFAGMPEVYNLFMDLAQKAVDAGIDCPCATIEERSDVR